MSIREEDQRIKKRKRIASPNSNQGEEISSRRVSGVGGVVRRGIFREIASRKRTEKAKAKRKIPRMSRRVMDVLILSLAGSSESWVIDSGASFRTTSRHDIFQNYVKDELEKVYLGDDKPCDIIVKGDVMASLSNDSTLKLRNVRHVPKLKRNLITIYQLADGGKKITFDGDVRKSMKGAMVMAQGRRNVSCT